jgi:hypothetical protein
MTRWRCSIALLAALVLAPAPPALAQDAAAVRGGWLADVNGVRHILYLVARNETLSGVYCTRCDEPGNLAFVQDGALGGGTVRFALQHQPDGARAFRETVQGSLVNGELELTFTRTGAKGPGRTVRLHRGVHVPRPAAQRRVAQGPAYVAPGPPEPIAEKNVVGLWLAFTGPQKQYFMFRRVGTRILGLVCGPCDNPGNMAPLDHITIDGTTLRFHIVHEDNGVGFDDHGPFDNVATATIARHEMHISVLPSYDLQAAPVEMTMVGPVADTPAGSPSTPARK